MLKDHYSDEQRAAAEELVNAISPDVDLADQHLAQFREMMASEADEDDYPNMMWVIKEIVDWESGYFVDWKDTESFVQCVMEIADRWGATLTFGCDDPLDEDFLSQTTVPDLAHQAHSELLPQGFTLWGWDTQGDCYSGWITKSTSASRIAAIAATLDVEVRPGDEWSSAWHG